MEAIWRTLRWLRQAFAPLEKWFPFIASMLFAFSTQVRYTLFRVVSLVLVILISVSVARDFAQSLLEREPSSIHHAEVRPSHYWQMAALQLIITSGLAGIYCYLIMSGLLFYFPFMVTSGAPALTVVGPVVFILCVAVAWKNTRLWYRQSVDYELAHNHETQAYRMLLAMSHRTRYF